MTNFMFDRVNFFVNCESSEANVSLHDVSPASWSVVPRRWRSTRVNDDDGSPDAGLREHECQEDTLC